MVGGVGSPGRRGGGCNRASWKDYTWGDNLSPGVVRGMKNKGFFQVRKVTDKKKRQAKGGGNREECTIKSMSVGGRGGRTRGVIS